MFAYYLLVMLVLCSNLVFILGFSALHFAARYGNADIIKVLCDAGADVAATDDFGRIPLHWAAEYDRAPVTIGSSTSPLIEATQHLLVAGSDVTARDEAGAIPDSKTKPSTIITLSSFLP